MESDNGKNIAIIAHIALIGWLFAYIMHSSNKTPFGAYYLRQTLGIHIAAIVLSFIPILGWLVLIALVVFWVMSLVSAVNDEQKPIPLIGEWLQDIFKGIQ